MPAPSTSWGLVRVYGTWHNLPDGTMKVGTYSVSVPVRVTNATDDVMIPAGVYATGALQTADPSQPSLDLLVPANDDPDNLETSWKVTVQVTFTDGSTTEKYVIDTPLAARPVSAGGTGVGVDLAKIAIASGFPTQVAMYPIGVAGGLAKLNSAGKPVDANGNEITGGTVVGSEPVTWASIPDKPATFAPTIGTTATTAKAGNWKPAVADITATGTPSTSTFLRGDGTWSTPPAGTGVAAYVTGGGYYLDSFTGTDDERLTAAISAQQASGGSTNMAPIILPNRPLSFTTPRTLYSGVKIIGANQTGQKNPELSSGNFVGPEITLGGTITSGTASWWNGTGSVYNVFMSDFSVQGSQGSSVHQFLDQPSGTLYACEFHALSFNFMRGVFGRSDRKCLMTQVALTGSWTMNNAWDCQVFVGGSDCIFWMDSFANIGVSQSAAQTGTLGRYFLRLSSVEAQIGKAYMSTMNGWRGVLIEGTGTILDMHGTIIEGYKPTRVNGLLAGPGPGSQVKVDGGAVSMHGCKIGQGMDNPDASEGGLVQIGGGEVSMFGVNFYGANMDTANAVKQTAGRLSMYGTTKRQNEAWTGRPRVSSTGGTFDHDTSVTVV